MTGQSKARRGLRYMVLLAIVALICSQAALPLLAEDAAQAVDCPSGCTEPGGNVRIASASDLAVGDEVVIDVYLENFNDLYGAEIEFYYDPSLLEVQDDKPGTVGTQIMPGDMPDPEEGFVVQNAVDAQTGSIAYAVALLNPSPAASGSGILCHIRFKVLGAGSSVIGIMRAVFVASNSCCLEITSENGTVSTAAPSGGAVAGVVKLQGRTNFSGATVSIAGKDVLTAADGSYTITGIAAGSYTISASAPSYLDSQKGAIVVVGGNTTLVPEVTLLAGDIDNNCVINIFDLVALGNQYGSTPPVDPRADFNQDGTINIFDLVLLAGNYGKTCPTPWQ